MLQNRRYGYLHAENDGGMVQMVKGQNIAGYPIGIIYIDDVYYPMMPGNVVNAYTYDFPVRMKAVDDIDCQELFHMDEHVYERVITACQKLRQEGVRAISGACGFFGNYQKAVAAQMDIPVALSSLVQIPWVAQLLKPSQEIGIITADASSITDHLLDNCGITPELKKRLVIKDALQTKEFNCVVKNRGMWDNTVARQEIVSLAKQIVSEFPTTGAIVLECSDMPPYAYCVQETVQLPVFDFITLIKWLHSSVCQMPYDGFI